MGQGLYFNPADGGPVMEITAGLRCPTMCAQWNTQNWEEFTTTISNYVPGSTTFLMPRQAAVYRDPISPSLIPFVVMLTGYTISGNTVTQTWYKTNSSNVGVRPFDASLWQILPASQGSGTGLLIQNSTDWTAIPLATMAGFCVWRGTLTVAGEANLPATGYPQSQQIVFADWSAPGITIECDGSKIYAYKDELAYNDQPAAVTLNIAIFASGIAPTPSPGLNMFNSSGQCVFSLNKRPFIFTGASYVPSFNAVDVGPNMVPLGTYGFYSDVASGWTIFKLLGLVRDGNVVRLGAGKIKQRWTANYALQERRAVSLTMPLVPKMY